MRIKSLGKVKQIMGFKKAAHQIDVGVLPHVSFYYERIRQLPIISFANVGAVPENNGIGVLTEYIKKLCGYGWANGIEGLHYYSGSRWSYPFHVHVHFDKFLEKRRYNAQLPDVKSAKRYEFTLYDPLEGLPILSFTEELKQWNSRISPSKLMLVGDKIKQYENHVMSKCRHSANVLRQSLINAK